MQCTTNLADRLKGPASMLKQSPKYRLTTAVAVTGLLFAHVLPPPAAAQGMAPQSLSGAQDQQTAGDPPDRVGRLARVSGTVSFHTRDDDQWTAATPNYPVNAGDAFWTEPNAQAEIELSASRIIMAPATELDIATLNDASFQASQPQGEIYLRVRAATPDETYAVQTPRGLATFAAPGRYAVAAGDTQTPTTVTVIEGSAQISGPGLSMQVGPNQTATISGSDPFQSDVGPAQRDPFVTAMLERERPPPTQAVAPPPVVAAMPGGEELAAYGSWSPNPEYGQVWYPQVAQDWVPYRDGRWAYVAPWGWTWVDNQPWGFAPFHYGRWVRAGGRWGWYPGAAPRPVYAPALVTFFGVGAAAGIGIGAALTAGSIGWCPLGPREVYRPWYHASDRYVRQVNVAHVTNFTTVNRNVTINNFVNRSAATVVPTSAMTASRPVRPVAQRLDTAQFAQARPVFGQQPLRPTVATAGVTPVVARQLNLGPAPGAIAQRPVAPGPAIRSAGLVPGAVGGSTTARPPLPQLHNPELHNPGQPAVPAAGTARPFTGQPPLANPGSQPAPPVSGGAPGPSLAPRTGAPVSGGPGTPPAAPALRTPVAPNQAGPPPIQPPGGGVPASVARPIPVPGAASLPPGPTQSGPQRRQESPAAVVRPGPQVTAPAAPTAPPQVARPVVPPPAVHAPPAPAPVVQAGPLPPPQMVRPTPPPPVVHAAPPPAPVVRAPAPVPQVQAPLPPQHVAAPPPPQQFHPPPPQQQFHPPPAAPAAHSPPPPPAAPVARAPPPQQQQPQQQRQKRPGEP
jgi:hypothetical protein